MDLAAALTRNVIYPLWVRKNGSARLDYLAQLRRSQYWSREVLEAHRFSMLQKLIAHAYQTCSYYESKFRAVRVTPQDIRSWADVDRLPILTKEEIQANRDAMISSAYRRENLIEDMTGGSTGSPLRFFYDRDRHEWREGATLRHDQWSGWDIGRTKAILWGASQDLRKPPNVMAALREQLIERRLLLDASALDAAAMTRFANQLLERKPFLLQAYANTLALFAKFVQAQKIEGITPGAIITSAEVLTPEARADIEATFRCKVFNRYGCREFAVIASECEAHGPMHINAENLLVEVLVDGVSKREASGEIVVTDLRNLAMPMIRYAIRDTGKVLDGQCSCGRTLPLFEIGGGRVTDFLTATSGAKVSGIVIATYVSTSVPGIAQIQILQRELGKIEARLVHGASWNAAAQDQLVSKLREYLGADMQVEIVRVDRIEHERSGKFRFSISYL